MRGLFVTGTDTGVGKTWIGCAIARALTAQGISVVPRKPVESGCRIDDDRLVAEDAEALIRAAGYEGGLRQVCPWRFAASVSPERAARLQKQSLRLSQLIDASRPQANEKQGFLLVEGAGGFYSPLCEDALNADLAQALRLPVLLVAEDRLGAINGILLSLEAIEARRLTPVAVILNKSPAETDGGPLDNLADLQRRLACPVYALKEKQQNLPDSLIRRLQS